MNHNRLVLKRYFLITLIFINVKFEQFRIKLYLVQYITENDLNLLKINWSHNTRRTSIYLLFIKITLKNIKTCNSKKQVLMSMKKSHDGLIFLTVNKIIFCQDY